MQLTAPSPSVSSGPAARAAAADRLVYVPGTVITRAEQAAAARDAAGTPTSPAQLLLPFTAHIPLERAHATMLDAVDGAIRIAPELAAGRAALLDAVAGVIAVLRTAAADQLQRRAWDAHDSFALDLERAAEPLYAAAAELMPWS